MLAGGHVLLEDVPGVGKTTMALAFSRAMGLRFRRIQFTPDVVPSDVTGYVMFDRERNKFVYRPGAAVCNLLLADEINRTRENGGRVIAVGTTSCRTLESAAGDDGTVKAGSGWTDIFIYPGYTFKAIDALITNFHLPESTLIMLVSAFAGKEHIMDAYQKAVEERYRFFSFGDAMMIADRF